VRMQNAYKIRELVHRVNARGHLSALVLLYSPSAHHGTEASEDCCCSQSAVRYAVCSPIFRSKLLASSFSSRPKHMVFHSKSLSASCRHSAPASPV